MLEAAIKEAVASVKNIDWDTREVVPVPSIMERIWIVNMLRQSGLKAVKSVNGKVIYYEKS